MPIVDTTKLDAALASKDKAAIKAALADISTGTLSKEEKAALHVSLVESYLDTMNAFNAEYKAFLKQGIDALEKTDTSIRKAGDAEAADAIRKSI